MPKPATPKPLHLKGTSGADRLYGNVLGDFINGMQGDDELGGGGGNDTINGGAGNDLIIGGEGADILSGGAGRDTYQYSPFDLSSATDYGVDFIKDFNTAEDVIDMTTINGGVPATLHLSYDASFIGMQAVFAYNVGTDRTTLSFYDTGSSAPVFEIQFGGNITYSPTAFGHVVIGPTEGDDDLVGTEGDDGSNIAPIDLLSGDDIYDGLGGNDWVRGSGGNDTILGGDGNDALIGDGGEDSLSGGDGNDTVVGEDGNDSLYGGGGNDFIVGGGGGGNDLIDGGTGDTDYAVFYFAQSNVGSYSLVAGSGVDAGKMFVMLTNGASVYAVAEITSAADGTVTVTGIGAATYLGTDTVTNVDRLLFSTVSDNPFVTPVTPGYLVVDVDTDLASVANFGIYLLGATSLMAADFSL